MELQVKSDDRFELNNVVDPCADVTQALTNVFDDIEKDASSMSDVPAEPLPSASMFNVWSPTRPTCSKFDLDHFEPGPLTVAKARPLVKVQPMQPSIYPHIVFTDGSPGTGDHTPCLNV